MKRIDVAQPGKEDERHLSNNFQLQRQNLSPNDNPHTHLKHVLMMISFKTDDFQSYDQMLQTTKKSFDLLLHACHILKANDRPRNSV